MTVGRDRAAALAGLPRDADAVCKQTGVHARGGADGRVQPALVVVVAVGETTPGMGPVATPVRAIPDTQPRAASSLIPQECSIHQHLREGLGVRVSSDEHGRGLRPDEVSDGYRVAAAESNASVSRR